MATLVPEGDQSRKPFAIARLIPVGLEAEQAFDDVVTFPGLSKYHGSFIRAKRIKRKDPTPEVSSEDTDAEEDEVVSQEAVELWVGNYLLDTSTLEHLENPRIEWRAGRGTSKFGNDDREVEILLIRPGRKSDDVSKMNAAIRLHEKSGVLMLVGLSNTHPITYECGGQGQTVTLRFGEKHVLYQKQNRFSFGKLRFKLEYEDFDDTKLAAVTKLRDRFFLAKGLHRPHPRLSMIPRRGHNLRGSAVLHTAFGRGTFGHVHAAVDTRTGNPLAIKDMWIDNAHRAKHPELIAELDVSQGFKNTSGLLQALRCHCQHLRETCPCGEYPEQIFMTFPLGLRDFSKQDWRGMSLDIVAKLLREPLEGLASLHSAGYMHRDVSPSNILVMSDDPPQAALCDYGKATKAEKAFETTIGPIPFLAPEVGEPGGYTNKIDIWGVGLVCCSILFPKAINDLGTGGKRPNINWWWAMLEMLSKYKKKGKQENSFADLIEGMFCWRHRERYTASAALQHPFLQPPSTSALDTDEESLKHKTRADKT